MIKPPPWVAASALAKVHTESLGRADGPLTQKPKRQVAVPGRTQIRTGGSVSPRRARTRQSTRWAEVWVPHPESKPWKAKEEKPSTCGGRQPIHSGAAVRDASTSSAKRFGPPRLPAMPAPWPAQGCSRVGPKPGQHCEDRTWLGSARTQAVRLVCVNALPKVRPFSAPRVRALEPTRSGGDGRWSPLASASFGMRRGRTLVPPSPASPSE